jgi:hypothetical protein
MRHPALVFGAVLVRTIDAAHPKHASRNAEGARIFQHVLIRRAFRATIRAAEIQRTVLGNTKLRQFCIRRDIARLQLLQRKIAEPAINLVGEV